MALADTYQQALQRGMHVATVSDVLYQRWMDEVAALPARKKAKWSAWVKDKYGCRISVRCAPREIGFGVLTLFEERLTAQSAADRGVPAGTWIPILSVSLRAALVETMEAETGEETLVADVASRTMERVTHDNAEHVARAQAEVAARHTGNHRPRTHAVAVPTAPGQPVRG